MNPAFATNALGHVTVIQMLDAEEFLTVLPLDAKT